ncbi:ExeM/NucH family extracellular endonuclease [Modestobacter italicus]|uniref:ExeM/NucH family extracellular endonuclease n=1 Tax=Modestobacter italicus (strain DSM 44449 / CECT 9708 / BC 501) TaxID=2732864 RepID=UPI001C969D28|nr:ExeM/NucH family extracellular endonuclease [Modestobacter italicus]
MSLPRTPRSAVLGLTVGALTAGGLAVAAPAQAAPADARITEVHYDNAGTDSGEAIEVAAPAGTDLVGLQVVLYNGNNSAAYGTRTIAASDVTPQADGTPVAVLTYPANGIQNGAPDGVALATADGTLIEFLSYEGTMTAADGVAAGTTATDIGVAETGTEDPGQSLQRVDEDSWTGPAASTFGVTDLFGTGDQPDPEPDPDPSPEPDPTPTGTAELTEIHYDNGGTDSGEAIEVTADGPIAAGAYTVVLYNGSNGATYDTDPVPASETGISVVTYPSNGLQNGAPDAFALVDADGAVVEFLSYEGTLTATNGPAAGTTSTDIGVAEAGTEDAGQSLQRTPGEDTWFGPAASTFGAANTPGNGGTPGGGELPVGESCDATVVTIGSVQGPGAASPVQGQTVTVRGTVVGDLQDGGLDGVHVQDAGDGDPATSDGVFVYGEQLPALDLGDTVTVTGTVSEFYEATQITATAVTDCGPGELPAATPLPLPSTDAQREALESMLVEPADDLTVTEVYNLNRYGEVVLAAGGRLVSPTEAAEPGPASTAVQESNEARSVIVDDGRSTSFGSTGEAPPYLTADDPVRVGDGALIDQPVVLSYGFDEWRLQPSDGTAEGTSFPERNPRTAAPEEVRGDLRIADFNVLNYFIRTPDEVGSGVLEPRGATSESEFQQQEAKIVAAMAAMDADVFTLHEIENSALYSTNEYEAVETLIAALEEVDGHDWDHVRAREDTDAITNAIIFRTDRVSPVGAPTTPTGDEAAAVFANARTPIAQTFDFQGEVFSVIANHFKSKGSSCGADSDDTSVGGQGNCNGDRVAQAEVLVDFAGQVAAASGDTDVLLTGDFNSYRNEDPLDVVRAAGYQEVREDGEYSYVFDGAAGSLDHVFATPSLFPKITGHDIWEINAEESFAYQYAGYEPFFSADPYRSSDHNPTLIGITPAETDVPAQATISDPRPYRGERITVTGTGFEPGERVTASLPSRNRGQLGSAVADSEGTVTIRFTVPVLLPTGDQEVLLRGTSGETASTGFELRSVLQELLDRLIGWWHRG